MDPIYESLEGSLTRQRALETLLAPRPTGDPDSELILGAGRVEVVDVVAATAARMRIARHLREHTKGSVTIWPPRRNDVAARFLDLLSPLPDRVSAWESAAVAPTTYTLVPATQVNDSEDAMLVGEVALDACRKARVGRARAGFIAEAALELSDNAVVHAAGAPDPPVVAVTSFGRERVVEVAVTDAGTAISEGRRPAELLAALPRRAIDGEPGFLGQILRRGRRASVDVSVQIMAGTGRLLWTPRQHRTDSGTHVTGLTVVTRIGA